MGKLFLKRFKLLAIALATCGTLFAGYLIYPNSITRALAQDAQASRLDYLIFLEAISLGFTIGFIASLGLAAHFGDKDIAASIQADRVELKAVFLFISGLMFLGAGLELLDSSAIHGVAQLTWCRLTCLSSCCIY